MPKEGLCQATSRYSYTIRMHKLKIKFIKMLFTTTKTSNDVEEEVKQLFSYLN